MLLLDIVQAEVIEFRNLENTGNYSMHVNFKRNFPKIDILGI